MRPSKDPSEYSDPISCMQLTDRRIYFTWEDARRREDVPLFEDAENAQELPPPVTLTLDQALGGGYGSTPLDADSDALCSFCRQTRSIEILWVALTSL